MRFSHCLFLLPALFAVDESTGEPRLHYVATAAQKGPVAHRDPVGVISPDGEWFAYSEGRFLKVRRIRGGPVRELEPASQDIRYVAWLPDGQNVAVLDRGTVAEPARWYLYDIETGSREALWAGTSKVVGVEAGTGNQLSIALNELRNLVWSPDGEKVAGVVRTAEGSALWSMNSDGSNARVTKSSERLSLPAFHPTGERLACLSLSDAGQRLNLHCGDPSPAWIEGQEVYGPVAFAPDGDIVYYASPNERGTLDLWSRQLSNDKKIRLTNFARDAYAPSVDEWGRVFFKVQSYHPVIAVAPASGGMAKAVTTFMAETPSWDWTGKQIGFTYGNWRRVVDDFRYPDITQHVGIIHLDAQIPAKAPHAIVNSSMSEDQGQGWSPNGKWIAFHSHDGPSDDIWLVPADGSKAPWQITENGNETGWPRWSPDGKWLAYSTQKKGEAATRIYVLGVDQESGAVTQPEKEVALLEFKGEVSHVEWGGGSRALLFEAFHDPGNKAIYRVDRAGSRPQLIHRFESEDKFSGIGVSPKGDWVAFVGPGPRGYQQVYRIPVNGGEPQLVTTDPSNKTHPAYSPDGEQVAFTVWSFESHFWRLTP